MIDRLKEFIDSQDISVSAFEQSIQASDGMIRRAIKNGTDIQGKWFKQISDNYPKLNLDWLITGNGPMLRSDEPKENDHLSGLVSSYEKIANAIQDIAASGNNISEANKILAQSNSDLVHRLAMLMDELNKIRIDREHISYKIKDSPPMTASEPTMKYPASKK